METRSERLRRHHRRVLFWSIAAAAALHIGLFALSPEFSRSWSEWSPTPVREGGEELPGLRFIDVTFGPPTIHLPDGEVRTEPPDRVLEARNVPLSGIPMHPSCEWVRARPLGPVTGKVRLVVGEGGRVMEAGIAESFGGDCVDQALVVVAGTLWYHWLPSDEAPAPVELIQPMTAEPIL